jgi:hypothetical protein
MLYVSRHSQRWKGCASEVTLGNGLAARMRSKWASKSMTGAQKGQYHTGGTSRSGGLTQLQFRTSL